MSYADFEYVIGFLPAVYLCCLIMPKKLRWPILLFFSIAFCGLASGKMFVMIMFAALVILLAGIVLGKINAAADIKKTTLDKEGKKLLKKQTQKKKKAVVAIGTLIILGLLAFLKYGSFFASQINGLFGLLNINISLPLIYIGMPVGISFYSMQAVSYITDVYRGKVAPEKNYFKLLLFLCFFPTVVQGPMCRFDQIGSTLYSKEKLTYENFLKGILLVLWGMFKKMVIADRAATFGSYIFGDTGTYTGGAVVLGTLIYTLQLYSDFSGCFDIAFGSAKLFGIELAPNFNQPFFSGSVSEFWRRWHISLGTWFKDYVFYPVSLSSPFMKLSKKIQSAFNRFFGSLLPASIALFVVWFSTGIWHGASWKYVLYGLYYFILIFLGMLFEPVFQKLCSSLKINRESAGFKVFRVLRTFVLVNIGMLLFRADTFNHFIKLFTSIFKATTFDSKGIFSAGLDIYDFIMLAIGAALMLIVGILKEKGVDIQSKIANGNMLVRWFIYWALILGIMVLGAYGANYVNANFIYAQF